MHVTTFGINKFLDLSLPALKNMTFREPDLFPSSGEGYNCSAGSVKKSKPQSQRTILNCPFFIMFKYVPGCFVEKHLKFMFFHNARNNVHHNQYSWKNCFSL
jgi:hypothetical protein